MPRTCWAPGCKTGYRSTINSDRHLFSVPADKCLEWSQKIPRDGQLTSKHYICDIHFEEHFITKSFETAVGGQSVAVLRERWRLTSDAVPTIFPNIPSYLSKRIIKRRTLKRHFNTTESHDITLEQPEPADLSTAVNDISTASCSPGFTGVSVEHNYATSLSQTRHRKTSCSGCQDKFYLNKKLAKQNSQIRRLQAEVRRLTHQSRMLKQQLEQYNNMPQKMKLIVQQAARNCDAKSSTGIRYSDEWLIDSLLIRCKSTSAYRMLREGGFLPLPSLSTLNRSIRNLKPEFGFDPNLFSCLKQKLLTVDTKERRGVLMFDEVQISRNVEFRVDTCKVVGMVDFGDLTSNEQKSIEGDHALVFLFQPHLSGWVQTVGCFCSSGTTPAVVLSELIMKCIVLLENCGAIVDGLVSDGATTNRSALAHFGFSGSLPNLQNKMVNPCDETRNIYFFCDTPHLLKTIRNNLLRAKQFMMPDGTVKLKHYELLYQHDLNAKTGLRAVPKLTDKHLHPNNFQKMSVSTAAQLFSKSVADGLTLYKSTVHELRDCDATVSFTLKINNIFDLLNGRRPVEGIRLTGKRNRLQELQEACEWLDDWERFNASLPLDQQKQFLSSPTCYGLRCTLHSAVQLTKLLLSEGYQYVLTGKFNQDPLEMFFGMIRQSCGGSDHPTANQFLYSYRLLSANSLIKPARRANVTAEPVKILGQMKTLHDKTVGKASMDLIEQHLDMLLEQGGNESADDIDVAAFSIFDHDYYQSEPEKCILYYLSGYVAHKLRKFTSCEDCVQALIDTERTTPDAKLIQLKTRGGLQIPSLPVTKLLSLLEQCIQKFSAALHVDIYNDILSEALSLDDLVSCMIGCSQHCSVLTARCVHFYIVARLFFLRKARNRSRNNNQQKQKLSKLSKLT